jgi:hypothetical protein
MEGRASEAVSRDAGVRAQLPPKPARTMSFPKPGHKLPDSNAAIEAASLALRIAHCEEMEAVIAGKPSPCSEIVRYQRGEPFCIGEVAHQLPDRRMAISRERRFCS